MFELDPKFLYWSGIIAVLVFFITLAVVPWVLVRIPHDYFATRKRPALWKISHHPPAAQVAILILKNGIGALFFLLGMAMLLLPGPGVLMIMLGIALMNFPGKFQLERWVISRGPTLELINRFRVKRGRAPLILDVKNKHPE